MRLRSRAINLMASAAVSFLSRSPIFFVGGALGIQKIARVEPGLIEQCFELRFRSKDFWRSRARPAPRRDHCARNFLRCGRSFKSTSREISLSSYLRAITTRCWYRAATRGMIQPSPRRGPSAFRRPRQARGGIARGRWRARSRSRHRLHGGAAVRRERSGVGRPAEVNRLLARKHVGRDDIVAAERAAPNGIGSLGITAGQAPCAAADDIRQESHTPTSPEYRGCWSASEPAPYPTPAQFTPPWSGCGTCG